MLAGYTVIARTDNGLSSYFPPFAFDAAAGFAGAVLARASPSRSHAVLPAAGIRVGRRWRSQPSVSNLHRSVDICIGRASYWTVATVFVFEFAAPAGRAPLSSFGLSTTFLARKFSIFASFIAIA